jgi:hypothetical protein
MSADSRIMVFFIYCQVHIFSASKHKIKYRPSKITIYGNLITIYGTTPKGAIQSRYMESLQKRKICT